jgi:hypothetical protein
MPRGFAQALESNPAPARLGDVRLRYEPSLLIGETARALPSLRPVMGLVVGVGCLSFGLVALITDAALWLSTLLIAGAAAGFFGSTWLQSLERRRRRFLLNFETLTLRLDFSTPIAGAPRTLNVHFDGVRALALLDQADGRQCLVVDFVPRPGREEVFREVLVAYIGPGESEAAERVERVLRGAFGLGEIPADSPFFDGAEG